MVGPGGRLLPEYYPTYAEYLTRYILDMQAHGQLVDYITTQNEVRQITAASIPCVNAFIPRMRNGFHQVSPNLLHWMQDSIQRYGCLTIN